MIAFKKAKDVGPKELLKKYLHETLSGIDPPRTHKRIHASDVSNTDKEFCPRESALLDATKHKKAGQFLGTAMRYTFDLGSAMADLLCNRWAVDLVVGDWKCQGCGVVAQFCKKPKHCSECNCKNLLYQELRFTSQVSGISGGIDLMLHLPGTTKYRVVEAKSLDKDYFKKLETAYAEHRFRTNLYMRVIEESDSPWKGMIDTKNAIVFYMMKGYGTKTDFMKEAGIKDTPFSPFKEFKVKRNDEETEDVTLIAKQLYEFRKGTSGMPDRICPNTLAPRAASCTVRGVCFSKKYPVGMKCKGD